MEINGFTEAEAEKFVENKQNKNNLKFGDIKHISGTNPYLLAVLMKDHGVHLWPTV